MRSIFLFAGLILMNSLYAKTLDVSNPPTVGYFPEYFPRDPLHINTYQEHMLLGQVYETLVETDHFGKIKPGVAKRWIFKDNEIIFHIDKNKKFTNGKDVTAEDAVYSLKRHIENNSQSTNLLSSIKEIKVIDKYSFKITVKEKRVSLIKALSREQLGIVPKDWRFNPDSKEPYMGSGDYHLRKDKDSWFLHLKDTNKPKKIFKWRLLIGKTKELITTNKAPTYVPVIMEDLAVKIKKDDKFESHFLGEINSYTQSSAWVIEGAKVTKQEMIILNQYIEELCNKKNYKRVTGLVPKGIQGYLPESPTKELPKPKKLKTLTNLNISVIDFMLNDFSDSELINKLEKSYNLKLNITPISIPNYESDIIKQKTQIIVARWGGGFNDPEGFLAILSKILGVPFEQYLEKLSSIYTKAKKEENEKKRSDLFRVLGREVILNGKMLPLWETTVFYLLEKDYNIKKFYNRYTPRFIDVEAI